jgi:hypothetical protein
VPHYRFGPLTRMIVIDVPPGGLDEALVEIGATHVSLNGTATKDIFGYKRAWSIPLAGLAPTALSWFELCYRNAVGDCYFLDELRNNRLSEQSSSTLSAWSGITAFVASNGNLSATTAGVPLWLQCSTATGVVQALAPLSALRWIASAAGTCQASDTLVPVAPGEQVCFSCYAVAGAFTVELVPYDPTLAPLAVVSGGSTVAENLVRRYITYTAPTNGAGVVVRPQIRVTGATTVDSIGWQLEAAPVPSPWVLGSPPCRVLVALGTHRRRHFGNHMDGVLTLTEV